jgi:hypothetical protein
MFSNTNASTSRQSNSQKRQQLGQFSNSVERQHVRAHNSNSEIGLKSTNAKILIQNFLDNANQKNFGKKVYSDRESSVDHVFSNYKSHNLVVNKANTPSSNLRKSYDQQNFPRMASDDTPRT